MSTLNSWIDSDEISELLPFLLPNSGKQIDDSADQEADPLETGPNAEPESTEAPEAAGDPEVASDETGEDEDSTVESTEHDSDPEPEESVQVIDARETREPTDAEETLAEPAPEESSESLSDETEPALPATNSEIDFSTPDAYDASAFPAIEDASESVASPERQAAAVQAAVALERARSRADEVGLLKANPSDSSPDRSAEPEPAAEAAIKAPAVVGLEELITPPASSETEAPAPQTETPEELPDATAKEEAVESEPAPVPAPGTFRNRMALFADSAVELTGGSNPAITDFQSYPLVPATNGNRSGSPQSIDSILQMNRQISQIPGQHDENGGNTAQVGLSNGRWLCILTQDSASGGVCASFQVPAPISKAIAAQLHEDLRTALLASSD